MNLSSLLSRYVLMCVLLTIPLSIWTDRNLDFWVSFVQGTETNVPFWKSAVIAIATTLAFGASLALNVVGEVLRLFV